MKIPVFVCPITLFFRADSPSGKRIHGVGIFVKKNIPALRQRCELPNVLVIKLVHIDAHIVLIYRLPHVDTQLFSHLDLVFLTDEGRHANLMFSQPFPKCGHVIISFDFLYNNDDSSQEVERFDWSRGDYRAMHSVTVYH